MAPKVKWATSFPEGELDKHVPEASKTLLVAIDTEYTRKNPTQNLCLSYQYAVLNYATGQHKNTIYYPDVNTAVRLSLKEMILASFRLMNILESDINGYHIILICHFCSAEWAMMRDRKETARYLEFLYKTVITFKPIKINLQLPNGSPCEITFEVGDTMLLLPPSHRSLDKASSLLDSKFRKKDLTQFEKENMDILLKTDKQRFQEYAIHDAEITLRLFIKLQYTLNRLNGSKNTRYTTIGSATVKHFKKGMNKDTFKSQFAKNNTLYQRGLNLARRAYMGGLNSSYYIGERKGELFLDIDFSSAYPTVMNLLEVSDFGKPVVKESPKEFSLGEVS